MIDRSRRTALSGLALLPLLAGCAALGLADRAPPPGLSPAGQTLSVRAANGATSRMSFRPDGIVTARFGQRAVNGRWELRGDRLCFLWGSAPRECWPYASPFQRGRPREVTSDRGNAVRVTRL